MLNCKIIPYPFKPFIIQTHPSSVLTPKSSKIVYFLCILVNIWMIIDGCKSEAFPVHDGGTSLLVLCLGDPHGLECGE